jgi:hypothetical protein
MAVCGACGKAPRGGDRPLAYLFSSHHLSEPELDRVARRVRAGERPDPPEHLLQLARKQLTASLSQLPGTHDEPAPVQRELTRDETWLLMLGNVVLTPLIGLAVWWGWRSRNSQAADRVLWLTLPIAGLFAAAWVTMVVLSTGA